MAKNEKHVTENMLMEAVDTILNGMQRMFDEQAEKFYKEIMINRVHIQKNTEMINDLKWDTPTRKEFNNLERRVGKLEVN